MMVLGIETSCDETSVSVLNEKKVLSLSTFSQIELHSKFGGVVPEIASRSHLEQISLVCNDALKKASISMKEIDLISVTDRPGLVGGLLVGINFAKGLAFSSNKPLIFVDHLEGHIFTCSFNEGPEDNFFCLLISGGHTQAIEVSNVNNYQVIGKTIDDSVGESFDKLSKSLGFGYPGGALIEKMALKGNENRFKLGIPLKGKDKFNFSFSGLKTHFLGLVSKYKTEEDVYDICASFQKIVTDTLIDRVKNMISHSDKQFKNIVICGGVSANIYIRNKFEKAFEGFKINYAPLHLCTDNGAMIANIGRMKFVNHSPYN